MHHFRANPTMPMNQSRKLLRIGHKRLKEAKAKLKVPSTDEDIIRFHSSNPTATHRSIKETLRVGILRFRNVIASTSVTGSPSASRSCPKLQPPHGHSVPHSWNPPVTFTPLQHQQHQYFHPSQQMLMHSKHTSLAHTGSAASCYPMPVITGRDTSLGPRIRPSHNGIQKQQVPSGPVLLGHSTPKNASRLPSQTNGIMTSNSTSPTVHVKATKIPMPHAYAGVTLDTPHHHPRTSADPQACNVHVVDNRIHVHSKVRKEQSLAKSASINGQKYRTAADVVRCRHTKLTNQILELDAGFPMHYTETLK